MVGSGITVLICSYNGAARIGETLQHLACQALSGVPWEVIVVDNASTDDTLERAASIWQQLNTGIPLTILYQPVTGKSNALDLGFERAQHPYVLICDDDNWLAPDYLHTAFCIMNENPPIGVLGGRGEAVFESPPPAWFPHFEQYYAVGPQYPQSGDVTAGKGIIWGAGAVVRKEAYDKLKASGYQRFLTWQNAGKLSRSEDGEFCLAIRLAGYRIWYDDRLRYRHWMEAGRLNWGYLMQLVKDGGQVKPVFDLYRQVADQLHGPVPTSWFRLALRRSLNRNFLKSVWLLLAETDKQGNRQYQARLFRLYDTLSLFYWRGKYDALSTQLVALKKNMRQSV